MENSIGTITDAKIISADRRNRIGGGMYITFVSSQNLVKGNNLKVVIDKKVHWFEVTDIAISGKDLSIDAKEVGYWATKLDRKADLDLRTLLELDVELVTDVETIKSIREQSCWC